MNGYEIPYKVIYFHTNECMVREKHTIESWYGGGGEAERVGKEKGLADSLAHRGSV